MGLCRGLRSTELDWSRGGLRPIVAVLRAWRRATCWRSAAAPAPTWASTLGMLGSPSSIPILTCPVRLRRRASDMHRGVTLVSGLGEMLPFGDGSFDTVVTTLVLCMVSDLRAVVAGDPAGR